MGYDQAEVLIQLYNRHRAPTWSSQVLNFFRQWTQQVLYLPYGILNKSRNTWSSKSFYFSTMTHPPHSYPWRLILEDPLPRETMPLWFSTYRNKGTYTSLIPTLYRHICSSLNSPLLYEYPGSTGQFYTSLLLSDTIPATTYNSAQVLHSST